MKIAIITDDGKIISQHFGRANFYTVLTIENGLIIQREMRNKLSHKHFSTETHVHSNEPGQLHGFGPSAQSLHGQMSDAIVDCEAVICGGMGSGAYQSMKDRGICPVVTDIKIIEEAAHAYIAGKLVDHIEKLH